MIKKEIQQLIESAFPKSIYKTNQKESQEVIDTLTSLIHMNPQAIMVFLSDYPRITKKDVEFMLANLDAVSSHCLQYSQWD